MTLVVIVQTTILMPYLPVAVMWNLWATNFQMRCRLDCLTGYHDCCPSSGCWVTFPIMKQLAGCQSFWSKWGFERGLLCQSGQWPCADWHGHLQVSLVSLMEEGLNIQRKSQIIFISMDVMWYVCCLIRFVSFYNHSKVSLVADGQNIMLQIFHCLGQPTGMALGWGLLNKIHVKFHVS